MNNPHRPVQSTILPNWEALQNLELMERIAQAAIRTASSVVREGFALRHDYLTGNVALLRDLGGSLSPYQAVRVVFPDVPADAANEGKSVAHTTTTRVASADGITVETQSVTDHFVAPVEQKPPASGQIGSH